MVNLLTDLTATLIALPYFKSFDVNLTWVVIANAGLSGFTEALNGNILLL